MGFIKLTLLVLIIAIALNYLYNYFSNTLPPVVEGYFHPRFRKVAEKLRQNVQSGKEQGCSFAAYYDGEVIVDLWGGYADRESQQPWEKDTLSLAFSVTKSIAALTIAKMVDRGWIKYDKPVSYYWPEFGKNGKENITVEILLSHQAGLVSFGGEKISLLDLKYRPKEIVKLLEDQFPHWDPGTAHGYHSVTFGYYIGVLAEKADPKHRNLSMIFKQEIADPLGIDFHIGIPKEEHWRVARASFPSLSQIFLKTLTSPTSFRIFSAILMYPDSLTAKSMMVIKEETSFMNRADVQTSGIPSFMGLGNARSLAQLYSYVALGGSHKGKKLLSTKTLNKVLTPMTTGKDLVLLADVTYGRGLMAIKNSRGNVMFGHGGYGGQAALADLQKKLSFGYVSNHLETYGICDDPRFISLYELVYDCLEEFLSNK